MQVAQECKLTVDVEDYVNSFRADLMNATAAWCRGARFAEVLKMSDVFEVGLLQTALLWWHLLEQGAHHSCGPSCLCCWQLAQHCADQQLHLHL